MKGNYLFATLAFLGTSVGGLLGNAHAQTAAGFAVNKFEPSERGSEWFSLESLDFRGKVRPTIGIVGDFQYRPLAIYNQAEGSGAACGNPYPCDGSLRHSIVRNQMTLNPGFSVVLFERLRLAASLPVVIYQDQGDVSSPLNSAGVAVPNNGLNGLRYPGPRSEQAIGDLRLGFDFRLLGEYGAPFVLALGAQAWIPTGRRANYTGDEEFRIAPRASVAGDVGVFAYAARLSFAYRGLEDTGPGGGKLGSELGFAVSAGLHLADKRLMIGPEIFGTTTVTDGAFQKLTTPMEGLFGLHYTVPGDIRFGAGVGTGLTRGYGSPEFRTLLNIEWAPSTEKPVEAPKDQDQDGIIDSEDACPTVQGTRTADPKTNGCPPDRDGDGVYDKDDACIDIPGEHTDDPKTNGCPADKDGDGVYDKDDACIDVAGVKSADPKLNGCPADTDGDGILDKEDACIDKPGIKTSDPKTNGCPDADRDKDGIDNDKDACPDEPGKADPDPKKNGCPKAFVDHGVIKILDQVKFKTSSAQIQPGKDSEDVLNAVFDVLKKHPEIKGIRVEGHTDNKGVAANNKKLSQDRAASVVKWLVGKGLDKNMFKAEGFGQEKPIDSNDTDLGRQNNRRVEFHILDAAPGNDTTTPPAPKGPAPKGPAPKGAAPAPKGPAPKGTAPAPAPKGAAPAPKAPAPKGSAPAPKK
ncbi:MAG: OmpA family protein [Polyangiaceae bacterium]|nr:OmpA family protein [Polyangiaceae bacterium]